MQIPAITGWHRYSPRVGLRAKAGVGLGQNSPSVVPPECPICEPCDPPPKCPTLRAPPAAKASVFGIPTAAAWIGLGGLFLFSMAAVARKRFA
jgi:hypothetical protein